MNRWLVSAVAALTLMVAAAPAFAAGGNGLGAHFHAGLSLDPDDFLVGLDLEFPPVAEGLGFFPSVEAGFGDVTMIAGNLDIHYQLQTNSKLAPYLGGGLTINWFDFDGGSNTDVGGSFLGGIQLSPKLYFEAKLGLGDVPDAKLVVGFRR